MHFKPSFELRDICGEQVLIANGVENIDFGALVHLNSTAVDIYHKFLGLEFSTEEVVKYITSEYDVDSATAQKDVEHLLAELQKNGIIE